MYRVGRRMALVLAVAGALLFAGAPVAAGARSLPDTAGVEVVDVGPATRPVGTRDATPVGNGLYWWRCFLHNEDTSLILLGFPRPNIPLNHPANCLPGGGEYGFAALITSTSVSHIIKVCNQTVVPFTAGVNRARPDGGATGEVNLYTDQPGGGCYSTSLSYPIRKFRATWDAYSSPWAPPYV